MQTQNVKIFVSCKNNTKAGKTWHATLKISLKFTKIKDLTKIKRHLNYQLENRPTAKYVKYICEAIIFYYCVIR